MTEFCPAEQFRLAELLGDGHIVYCGWCGGNGSTRPPSEINRPMCHKCGGTGRGYKIPTGLALIEACRKRGVFVFILPGKESYNVYTMILGTFEPSNVQYCVKFTNLETAIAIAALKGLESVANSESAN